MKHILFLSLLLVPALALAQQPEFVSLTNAPFIEGAGNASSLPDFLNNLYRICIGIAAVVAVLQIMRAGIMYMGGDSITEKKEAKNLIALSIGGLVLVLSPVIVFSIINPDILSLKIKNLDQLGVELRQQNIDNTLWTDTSTNRTDAKARCEAQGGTPLFTCTPQGGSVRTVPITESCAAGESPATVCRKEGGATGQVCPAVAEYAVSGTGVCNGANGYSKVDSACAAERCGANLPEGSACCARTLTTGEMYAWKGVYYDSASCAIDPARAASCSTSVLRGGAYATQAQCKREFESATEGKVLRSELECSCDFNIGSQGGGACLSDTPLGGTSVAPENRNPPGPQRFKVAYKATANSAACVGYVDETHPNMDACIIAEGTISERLPEPSLEFIFTKRCVNTEMRTHRFIDLPACPA